MEPKEHTGRRHWRPARRPHYDLASWADYVRGLADSAAAREMAEHSRSCEPCGRLETSLRRVAEAAERESRFAPPAGAVRVAAAIPSVRSFDAFRGPRLELPLIFDSRRTAALPIGVRSAHPTSRDLAFESPDYSVTVTVSQPPGEPVSVAGEVVRQPDEPLSGIWVQGLLAQRRVAAGWTADNGDFELASGPEPPTELLFLDGERLVRVRLDADATAANG